MEREVRRVRGLTRSMPEGTSWTVEAFAEASVSELGVPELAVILFKTLLHEALDEGDVTQAMHANEKKNRALIDLL